MKKKQGRPFGGRPLHLDAGLCSCRTLPAFDDAWTSGLGLEHLLHAVIGFSRRWWLGWQLFAVDQQLDLGRIKHFALQQSVCDALQGLAIHFEDLLGDRVALVDELADLGIDLYGCIFAIVAVLGDFAAEEDLLFLL